MRDSKRISNILISIERFWRLCPDLKLGQLLINVAWQSGWNNNDIFYLEDDLLELALDDFYKKTILQIEDDGHLNKNI
jgi:uncharacterized protein YihD (DUF1040 family)